MREGDRGAEGGGDDGYASTAGCPIPPADARMPDGNKDQDDCYADTGSEDSFVPPLRTRAQRAIEPSLEEVARHNLTHIPYRSWCPHCVAARKKHMAHQQSSSAPRSLPLLVFNYCFVRDSETADLLTILVGRHYPSRALFAKVCEYKGQSDKQTVDRLCQFLRSTGAQDKVYKSDQEKTVVGVIREALRVSQTP